LKFQNQTLPEIFQSKSAEKKSVTVWLRNVKLILSSTRTAPTTTTRTWHGFFHQRSPGNFQAGSAENFSITIRLKKENQSSIDPDRFFDRDHDRG